MEKFISVWMRLPRRKTAGRCWAAKPRRPEPFIRHLGFNDLRYTIPFAFAKPVPAYAFVFHEYAVNFMGNHNTFSLRFPTADNPDSLLFRTAYSFAAGDMLTVVLKDNGEIHWDWDLDWDTPAPDQEAIQALIRNLSAMRRGRGQTISAFWQDASARASRKRRNLHAPARQRLVAALPAGALFPLAGP